MQNTLVLSVSQLNRYIKMNFDADENLANIFISGEISNFTNHYRTGHLYFTLKDDSAAVRAVMFNSSAKRLKFMPEDGMKVIARGRVSMRRQGSISCMLTICSPTVSVLSTLRMSSLKKSFKRKGFFPSFTKSRCRRTPKKSELSLRLQAQPCAI